MRHTINYETAKKAAELTETIASMRNPKFYTQIDYNPQTGEVFCCGIKDETRRTLNKMSNSPYTVHIGIFDKAQTPQDIMAKIRIKLLTLSEIFESVYKEIAKEEAENETAQIPFS